MTQENQPPADTELLRDLEELLKQGNAEGKEVSGNIEIAAIRMQAVKEISQTLRELRREREEAIFYIKMAYSQSRKPVSEWDKLLAEESGFVKIESEIAEQQALFNQLLGLES